MSEIRRAAVVGAGTMGHAIAQVFAQHGLDVVLVDDQAEVLDGALQRIRELCEWFVREQRLTAEQASVVIQRIRTTTDLNEAVNGVEFVLEAVTEDPSVKRELFQRLDALCHRDTIIASNSSSLDIFKLLESVGSTRLVATHWFTPPHIVALVEVAPGPETSRDVLVRTERFLRQVGKEPLVMRRFLPGLIVNRIQQAIAIAALEILESGSASAAQIDRAAKRSLGLRLPVVGVLQTFDFAGLDVCHAVLTAAQREVPTILDQAVRAGHIGVKASRGLYDYGGRSEADIVSERDSLLLRVQEAFEMIGLGGASPWDR